jgi:Mg-chelatase subunit ChlD
MPRDILVFDDRGAPELLTGSGSRIKPKQTIESGRIVLLLDCSPSMAGPKTRQAQDGGKAFAANALADGHRVGVISFADEAILLQAAIADRRLIEKAIESLQIAQGGTNIAAGVSLAARSLGASGRRTIVLVTDGMPHPDTPASRDDCLAMADEAKLSGIEIICIGTDDADLAFLRQLASLDEFAKHVSALDLKRELAGSYQLMKLLEA